jgi:WD40 repeat protein
VAAVALLVGGLVFNAELQAERARVEEKQASLDEANTAVQRDREAARAANGKAQERLTQAEGLLFTAQSSAVLPTNPGLALLLGIESAQRVPGALANNVLVAALNACREEGTLPHPAPVASAVFSPDGRRILTVAFDTVRIWDPVARKEAAPPIRGFNTETFASFSPDGKYIVTTYKGYSYLESAGEGCRYYTDRVARVWDAATGKQVARLKGHKDRVVSAVFSPDGRRLLTASLDQTARLWDIAAQKEVASFQHASSLRSAVFRTDGRQVLTATFSRQMTTYLSVLPGIERPEVDPPAIEVLSEDQRWQSGGSGRSTVTYRSDPVLARIWDAASGEEIAPCQEPRTAPPRLMGYGTGMFNPNKDQVLIVTPYSSANGTGAMAWSFEASTGKLLGSLDAAGKAWNDLACLSPDGRCLLLVSNTVGTVWAVAPLPGKDIATLKGHERRIVGASFSPDGKRIVTASEDRTVRIWDAGTGTEQAVLRGHEQTLRSVAFSPDGQRVVTASDDQTARIWNLAPGWEYAKVLRGYQGKVNGVTFNPDGRRLLTASEDKTARVWDSATGRGVAVLKGRVSLDKLPVAEKLSPDELLGPVRSATFSPDGSRILTVSEDDMLGLVDSGQQGFVPYPAVLFTSVRLWDADTGELLRSFEAKDLDVVAASFSPDGRRVLTVEGKSRRYRQFDKLGNPRGGGEGAADTAQTAVRVYQVDADKESLTLSHLGRIFTAVFSPDGQRILTCSRHHSSACRMWDAATGKELFSFGEEPLEDVHGVFTPDGQQVLTSWTSRGIRFWDAATGAARAEGKPGGYGITDARVSSDGRRVLTIYKNQSVLLWDAATGGQTHHLKGHQWAIHAAELSPDGRLLVTGSDDGTARLWDVASGKELLTLTGHRGAVLAATFSPDGQSIATASADGTARIWPVDPLPLALARKPRELTPEERARLGIAIRD